MDDLEFAQIALERVGDIAASVGAQLRRNGAGSLGATLVIIADNIESADIERKSKLRRRVPRLVKDLETICNVSMACYPGWDGATWAYADGYT